MIYVITAYRWGQRNGHSYVVGATTDLEEAKKIADEHVSYRGGKYGCEVCSCSSTNPHDNNAKQVYYVESPYYGAAANPGHFESADKAKVLDDIKNMSF